MFKKALAITYIGLVACSSSPPSQEQRIYRETQRLLEDIYIEGRFDRVSAQEALRLATINNDKQQQWRATLALCHHDPVACDDAERLSRELPSETVFITHLTRYLAHHSAASLSLAKSTASNQEQHTLINIITGKADNSDIDSLSLSAQPIALYYAGKANQNLSQLRKASELFLAQGNVRGSADANFLAAKLAHQQGNLTLSTRFSQQSKQLLIAIRRDDLAKVVSTWMEAHL